MSLGHWHYLQILRQLSSFPALAVDGRLRLHPAGPSCVSIWDAAPLKFYHHLRPHYIYRVVAEDVCGGLHQRHRYDPACLLLDI